MSNLGGKKKHIKKHQERINKKFSEIVQQTNCVKCHLDAKIDKIKQIIESVQQCTSPNEYESTNILLEKCMNNLLNIDYIIDNLFEDDQESDETDNTDSHVDKEFKSPISNQLTNQQENIYERHPANFTQEQDSPSVNCITPTHSSNSFYSDSKSSVEKSNNGAISKICNNNTSSFQDKDEHSSSTNVTINNSMISVSSLTSPGQEASQNSSLCGISSQNFNSINNSYFPTETSSKDQNTLHSAKSSPSHKTICAEKGDAPPINFNRQISCIKINVGSVIYGKFQNLSNLSDFWLEVWNFEESENLDIQMLSDVEPRKLNESALYVSSYCFAPLKKISNEKLKYQRAQIKQKLDTSGSTEKVLVFFIDFGIIDLVEVSDLLEMPPSYYLQPARAVPCYLDNVKPVNGEWSQEAIRHSLEICKKNIDPEIFVKSEIDGKFGIDFRFTFALNDENEHYFLSEYLCYHDFAIINSEPQIQSPRAFYPYRDSKHTNTTTECSNRTLDLRNTTHIVKEQSLTNNFPTMNELLNTTTTILNEKENNSKEQILCSDGLNNEDIDSIESLKKKTLHFSSSNLVSVKSASVPNMNQSCERSESNNFIEKTLKNVVDIKPSTSSKSTIIDSDSLNSDKASVESLQSDVDFLWNLVIPPAEPFYAKENHVPVAALVVHSPDEFYVRTICENSQFLDVLQIQINNFYEKSKWATYQTNATDLTIGTYCCFKSKQDGHWHRGCILEIYNTESDKPLVSVQYVDFGDSCVVPVSNIRPLLKGFAKYPSYALLCSLNGILPKPSSSEWSSDAIKQFQKIVEFESIYTAQIVGQKILPDNKKTFDVILWDISQADGSEINVNDILIKKGLAEPIDTAINLTANSEDNVEENSELSEWDPMAEHHSDIQNTYKLNDNDIGIAIDGYKMRDDEYICKFYRNKGKCHIKNCAYEHIRVGDDGVTREQNFTIAAVDNDIVLPKPSTCTIGQITHMLSPSHFYLNFPYGTEPVNHLAYPDFIEMDTKTEYEKLVTAMTTHYNNTPFADDTSLALSYGSIVAAKHEKNNLWLRAKVRDVLNVDKPVEVFFVDIGSTAWIKRQWIRELNPEFLHTSFQAVECFQNIKPYDHESGNLWSSEAKTIFREILKGKMVFVHVQQKIGSGLIVKLEIADSGGSIHIDELLIKSGLATNSITTDHQFTNEQSKSASTFLPSQCEPG